MAFGIISEFHVCQRSRGQIVIPKAARDYFGLKEGQRLILLSEDGEGFALVPAELFEEHMVMISRLASMK